MDFAHEVLKKILDAGHENLVISNTNPDVLDIYLDAVKITGLMTHKIGADSHRKDPYSRNSKIDLLKNFLKTRSYDQIISIGDRDTDMELGSAVGAKNYFFLNEINKKIEDYTCISDLRDLLKEL